MKKLSVRDLTFIGIFAAVIVVMTYISIPLPGVSFTMQTFAVALCAIALGPEKGFIAVLVYLLLGSIGLPVFSNFRGGLGMLFGATGGFLITFPIMAYIIGLGAKREKTVWPLVSHIALAAAINYLSGVVVFSFVTKNTLWVSFVACVLTFIPTDLLKLTLAVVIGRRIRRFIQKRYY